MLCRSRGIGNLQSIGPLIGVLPGAVVVVDARGTIVLANDAVAPVLGHDAARLMGQSLACLIAPALRERHSSMVAEYVGQGLPKTMKSRPVLQALHASGALVPVSISLSNVELQGERFSVAVIRDARRVSEQIDQAVALSETDALTGMANRAGLARRMGKSIAAERPFALLYCDLAGFKPFNDRHGHAVGDAVLRLVARRAAGLLRRQDLAARIGGDEFALVIDGITDAEVLAVRAEALAAALCRPMRIGGVVGSVGVNVGGALYPRDGTDEQGLLAVADAAMYRAKRAGLRYVAGSGGRGA